MLKIGDYESFSKVATPFYYYDIDPSAHGRQGGGAFPRYRTHAHSVKANSDRRLNDILSSYDSEPTVSWG